MAVMWAFLYDDEAVARAAALVLKIIYLPG